MLRTPPFRDRTISKRKIPQQKSGKREIALVVGENGHIQKANNRVQRGAPNVKSDQREIILLNFVKPKWMSKK